MNSYTKRVVKLDGEAERLVAEYLVNLLWGYVENSYELAREDGEEWSEPAFVGEVVEASPGAWELHLSDEDLPSDYWDAVCEDYERDDQDGFETYSYRGPHPIPAPYPAKPDVAVVESINRKLRAAPAVEVKP